MFGVQVSRRSTRCVCVFMFSLIGMLDACLRGIFVRGPTFDRFWVMAATCVKLEPSVRCFMTGSACWFGLAGLSWSGSIGLWLGQSFCCCGVVVDLGIGHPRCRFIIRPAPIAKLPRFGVLDVSAVRRVRGRLHACLTYPSPSRNL